MSVRFSAISVLLFGTVFLAGQQSVAYEKDTGIGYTVATNTISAISETWREKGDDRSNLYCAYWTWDDYGWYCRTWALELYDPLVDAYSLSPYGGSTTRGTDVDTQRATVRYDFRPAVHGKWTAQGEHYVRQWVFVKYCSFRNFCTGWIPSRLNFYYLGATAAEHSPIFLDIARHTSVSLSESTVDTAILPDATELLQTNDGPGDVACPISFRRNGAISVFSVGDGTIDTEAERDDVIAVPGRVHVVDEINYCSGDPPNPGYTITGCSSGAGMIVTKDAGGSTWAHEYGHNQYLWLLGHPTNPDSLGYFLSGPSSRKVTQRECDAMRNPLN